MVQGEQEIMAKDFIRDDGRKFDELRPMDSKVGVVPNADGSAMFSFGKTIAIAAVYGPKEHHPRNKRNPQRGTLRCTYNMLSFSVEDRIRPGPSRRSTEISKITQWALEPVLMLDSFPNMVIDVHIQILQASASTRCAGINAAAMALAHAGIPMKDIVSSVSVGKIDKQLILDVNKYEDSIFDEGEGATDIPITFTNDEKITHFQLDGKMSIKVLKEAIELAKNAREKIYNLQKKALKETGDIH